MAASPLHDNRAAQILRSSNQSAAIVIDVNKTQASIIQQNNQTLFKSNSFAAGDLENGDFNSIHRPSTCSEWLAQQVQQRPSAETPPPDYFFEGTEKLLEIWFGEHAIKPTLIEANNGHSNMVPGTEGGIQEVSTGKSPSPPLLAHEVYEDADMLLKTSSGESDSDNDQESGRVSSATEMVKVEVDLRLITDDVWQEILDVANCKILSKISNGIINAYLLSESSMFVSKRRLVLKTCGTTTPILAVEKILSVVRERFGHVEVDDMYYSRKNFTRPHLQLEIHKSFKREVQLLERFFPGAAYCMGRLNGDCWFLYTMHPVDRNKLSVPDQTLEVIMSDIVDDDVLDIFRRPTSVDGHEASVKSGITKLIDGVILDDFLFDPCGYSSNALLMNSEYYYDIHITPEKDFNYVSFETNVPQARYQHLVARLLKMFKPGKVLLTVFANHCSVAKSTPMDLQSFLINGYTRLDYQYCQLKNYDLSVVSFMRREQLDALAMLAVNPNAAFAAAKSHGEDDDEDDDVLNNNNNFNEHDNDDAGFSDGLNGDYTSGGSENNDSFSSASGMGRNNSKGLSEAEVNPSKIDATDLGIGSGDGGRANTIDAAVAFGDTADAEKQQTAATQELDRRAAPERIR